MFGARRVAPRTGRSSNELSKGRLEHRRLSRDRLGCQRPGAAWRCLVDRKPGRGARP